MDLSSLLVGAVLGGVALFFAGFIKPAGEDCYRWLQRRYFPKKESPPQVVINLPGGESLEKSRSGGNIPENKVVASAPAVEVSAISRITLDEIEADISAAPMLQRDAVGERFVGLHVRWKMFVQQAAPTAEGQVMIFLAPTPNRLSRVKCYVAATDYPQLKILKESAPVYIVGRIAKCSHLDVQLDEVKLEFLEG